MVVGPAVVRELGENETVSPPLIPVAENVTAPVIVPDSVIVELADDPLDTESEFGEAESE